MSESNGSGYGKSVSEIRSKKLGGVTGKGFMPGQIANPKGRNTPKAQLIFGDWLKKWLLEKKVLEKEDGEKIKCRRIEWVVNRLACQKPDVLLHYAYGKPAEMVEIAGAEGAPFEFVVRVTNPE